MSKKIIPQPYPEVKKTKLLIGLFIAVIGFVFYSNTLQHDYAFDDFSIIRDNIQTKKGSSALKEIFSSSYYSGYSANDKQLYRPLSKAMFALEWEIAPNKPALSHWVNVVLYAVTGFLLFFMLTLYFPGRIWFCAIASLLFIAHPIHTEVVANIKGRDEILSFLFFLLTGICAFYFVTVQRGKVAWLIGFLFSFFLSLLSKESAITFLAVIPLMIWFFTDAPIKKQLFLSASLCLPVILFFMLRAKILGSSQAIDPSMVDNILLATKSHLLRFTTAVYILGIYLKLLFIPYPLVSDNSYDQIHITGWADWHFIFSFFIFAGLGIYAVLQFRKKTTYSFGILFFFITASVTSNLFMLIGTSYGERFMYTPSLGFCLVISSVFMKISGVFNIQEKKAFILPGLITLIFFAITFNRNKAWKDNYSLHSNDVLSSPNSAKAHYYFGFTITAGEYLAKIKDPVIKQAALDSGMKEMRKSISINPLYSDPFDRIGFIFTMEQKFDSAAFYYKKALSFFPENIMYLNNYGAVLFNEHRLEESHLQFEHSLQINPNQPKTNSDLATVYGVMAQEFAAYNEPEKARKYFEMAIARLKKCVKPEPYYASRYYMMGNAYRQLGDEDSAKYYLGIARKLNQGLK